MAERQVLIPTTDSVSSTDALDFCSGLLKMMGFYSGPQHISLEGRLQRPDLNGSVGFILAHPHPKYGGSMESSVVSAFSELLPDKPNINCILRFNFRGVGKSGGSNNGNAEEAISDVKAVIAYVKSLPSPPHRIILIGYSFGSFVSFSALSEYEQAPVTAAVAISYPCRRGLANHITKAQNLASVNKLFIMGSNDSIGVANFETFYEGVQGQKQICTVDGADHYWQGRESDLVRIVLNWLKEQGLC